MVVKSTPFSIQSYNILYRINILIGLILINMFIKTKQMSCSLGSKIGIGCSVTENLSSIVNVTTHSYNTMQPT